MKEKRKINRSASKRFKVTANGKLLRRPVGLNHFNARDDGNAKRRKKGFTELSGTNGHNIKQLLGV